MKKMKAARGDIPYLFFDSSCRYLEDFSRSLRRLFRSLFPLPAILQFLFLDMFFI